MIPFDKNQFTVRHVKLKSVSAALSGSMKIINETRSEEKGHEVTERIEIPFALARAFKKSNVVSIFMTHREAAVVYYGDQVVMLELRPSNVEKSFDGEDRWTSICERNITKYVLPLLERSDDDWYTDGVYIYGLPEMEMALKNAKPLTKDGMFRGINVSCIKFMHLMDHMLVNEFHTRSIVAIVRDDDRVTLTPPIWKNIYDSRSSSLTSVEITAEENNKGRFDTIDELYDVNLEFGLNAGRTVGKVFGNEHIQPLRLPQLMVNLCTVNLPKVPKSIRETFGIGLPFLHAFAWLAGLMSKCDNMGHFLAMRGLMKQLMQKGMFRSDIIKKVQAVKASNVQIKMMPSQKAAVIDVYNRMTTEEIQNYWLQFEEKNARKRTRSADEVMQDNIMGGIE